MKELETLLENYWISKDKNKELYYRIKDSIPDFKSFVVEKLGYHIMLNTNIIKLEKLPGKAEGWMGIKEFETTMEYAFLCMLLMFLEDKGKEEQFVLSSITEFVQGNYPEDESIDWTLYRHRKCLIKVLRFAVSIGMIKVDDGDEQKFANNSDTEVLYESTGLSRYFVRNFSMDILNYDTYRDIENEEWADIEQDKGIIRRQRVYRRLIMSPVVYNEGPEDVDYSYIKNYRSMISNDLENHFEYDLHVHRNGALIVLDNEKNLKDTFPGSKAISDIVLLFNSLIVSEIKEKKIKLKADDTAVISKANFYSLLETLRNKYGFGWSKEYREMKSDTLFSEIIRYMQGYNMIRELKNEREIKLLPLCGKTIGTYPEDFTSD